eukprot:TRINITY_DN27394_c0_g1_i1.p1 TRINITY_DN27394_c0_g1~~TRINITY_DN27394_c0_g1_i1.p1  ORF type:complete len:147 (+),score=34.07 TRINITY_DN27394_c0_g1_i1:47-487(+)
MSGNKREFLELGSDAKSACVKKLLENNEPPASENKIKCDVKEFLEMAKKDTTPPVCLEGRVSPSTDQQVEINVALDDLVEVENEGDIDKVDGVVLPTEKTKESLENAKQAQGVALTSMVLSLFEKDSNYESDQTSSSSSSSASTAD